MPRSIAIFLTTAMLSATADLSGAEFVVIGSDLDASSLSADGHVVVGRTPRADESEAYIWSRETGMRMLGILSGYAQSSATDVSADGSVVVGRSFETASEPFLWTQDDGMVGLGRLPGFADISSAVNGLNISDDGSTVTGTMINFADQGPFASSAFRWTEVEGFVPLLPAGARDSFAEGVSADGRVIVGSATSDGVTYENFIWDDETGFHDLGPSPSGLEVGSPALLSADGSVVFGYANEGTRVFRWTAADGVEPLPRDSESSRISIRPHDVTPDGSILVGTKHPETTVPGSWRAFVWDEQHGTRDLREVLINEHGFSEMELPTLYIATGISADARTIVGSSQWDENRGGWAIYLDKPLVSPRGDFDGDHYRTVADIDLLSLAVVTGDPDAVFDVNTDGMTDEADRVYWVHELAKTFFGDADLDGEFNSSDFTLVFLAGQYEDAIDDNSGWAEGDWDGDADFTSKDMIAAFLDGGYEQGPRGVAITVPEPSSVWMVLMGALWLAFPGLRSTTPRALLEPARPGLRRSRTKAATRRP